MCDVIRSGSNKKVFIGAIDCNKMPQVVWCWNQKQILLLRLMFVKEEANQLLYPFKKMARGEVCLFKLAMRSDGTIDGGYITTQDSLEYVHKIRANLDLWS